MKKTKHYKWTFTARIRTNAFGWKGSRLACQRIKEAVSEVRKIARKDPLPGAEGAIKLLEKLWPALQHVDSSSGALGTAVYNATGVLVDVHSAFHYAIEAAQKIRMEEQVRKDIKKMVARDASPGMFMQDVLGEHLK
jgi:hypothetical protein